ncbi:MAG: AMP-binding protein [Solirubrobacterales bacterium]
MYQGVRTYGAILGYRAKREPDFEVLTFADGSLTYGELDRRATRIANAFAALGLEQGDAVAVQLPNSPEFVAVWFGLARAGLVEVPVNIGLRGDLLSYTLNQARCRAIVIADEWLGRVEAIAAELEAIEHVVVVGEELRARTLATVAFGQLLEGADTPVTTVVEPWDRNLVGFTSGTTGPSKGALLSHESGFEQALSAIETNEYEAGERFFTGFPLFHRNARDTSVLAAMILDGASAVLHQGFSASRFWETTREQGVTVFNFMGAVLLILLKQPQRPDDADNPVRKGWGAPAPPAIKPVFERRFGVLLSEGYGLTETGIISSEGPSRRKLGSCGKPLPTYEVEIQDERGNRLAPGEVGEICARPTRPRVMFEGYVGMPEASLEAFRGLWFHTGDRGFRDEEGWLHFVDRAKDVIRRRGENVSSWELEQVLNSYPSIAEAAVVGVPSELSEEEVLAFVQPVAGEDPAPEEILDFAQDRVPHFAVPRYIEFVDSLPKNPQQRLQKFILRELGLPDTAWDRESAGYVVKR